MPVLHNFVNPIADEPGFLGTKPSDWNDTHSVSIENADVDVAAGIEESKLSLNFPTHAPVTLGVANGLSLSGQQLSMALAGANSTGTLSAQDWNTFNSKQSALSFPLVASLGGTGISNTGTFTNHSNTVVVGGGTLSLGGYTLTVPATGTGALLGTENVFTAAQTIKKQGTGAGLNEVLKIYGGTDTSALSGGSIGIYDFFDGGTQFKLAEIGAQYNGGNGADFIIKSKEGTFGAPVESLRIVGLTGEIRLPAGTPLTGVGELFLGKVSAPSTTFGTQFYLGVGYQTDNGGSSYKNIGFGMYFPSLSVYYAGVIGFQETNQGGGAGWPNGDLVFGTAPNTNGNAAIERMRIKHDGKIAIGSGNTSPQTLLHLRHSTTTNNAILEVERIEAIVSTASTGGANGLGVGQSFYAETATDGTNQQQGLISTSWIDATNASRKAKMSLSAYDTAARLGIEIEASGTEAKLGFYGVATIARAVLATGVSATVDDVITALQNLGLVKQS